MPTDLVHANRLPRRQAFVTCHLQNDCSLKYRLHYGARFALVDEKHFRAAGHHRRSCEEGLMLREAIEQSDAVTGASGLKRLGYVVDGVGMVTSVGELVADAISIATRSGAWSNASFAFGVGGVLAQYVGNWLQLAGAHAQAMSDILKGQLKQGLAYGVVLGANGAKPNYVYDNFWRHTRPSLPFYPELEERALNVRNASLVGGYSDGKRLAPEQMRSFFEDIRERMSVTDQAYYDYETTPWSEWSAKKKLDFYSESAAIFQRDHLK
jgi:hypothetical protein